MNRNFSQALLVSAILVGAAMQTRAAGSANPLILYAFCHPALDCTIEEEAFGFISQDIVAAPDGNYYGTTRASSLIVDDDGNIDVGGSVYQFTAIAPTAPRLVYSFPRGYYPASWLQVSADGSLFGGYSHLDKSDPASKSEGHYRLTPNGEFTIVRDEPYAGFACNAAVQDGRGNLIGVTTTFPPDAPGFVYKITPDGSLHVLHTLTATQRFPCPHYEPVLASDGNLYGILTKAGSGAGSVNAIYRVGSDDSFTIVHEFSSQSEGSPVSPLTVGPDGRLYGVLIKQQPNKPSVTDNYLYGAALDGQLSTPRKFRPYELVGVANVGFDAGWQLLRLRRGEDSSELQVSFQAVIDRRVYQALNKPLAGIQLFFAHRSWPL